MADTIWLFGYGSLIWRPDIPHRRAEPAHLPGYERRFWQGSHDHRGTPEAPGRVVTLVELAGAVCDGVAFRVPGADAETILERLDCKGMRSPLPLWNGIERLRRSSCQH